jgi:hypothetical protein
LCARRRACRSCFVFSSAEMFLLFLLLLFGLGWISDDEFCTMAKALLSGSIGTHIGLGHKLPADELRPRRKVPVFHTTNHPWKSLNFHGWLWIRSVIKYPWILFGGLWVSQTTRWTLEVETGEGLRSTVASQTTRTSRIANLHELLAYGRGDCLRRRPPGVDPPSWVALV